LHRIRLLSFAGKTSGKAGLRLKRKKEHTGQNLSSHIRAEAGDGSSYLDLFLKVNALERRRGDSRAKPAGKGALLATEVMNTPSG
jgi:hypothetical protein